MSGCTCEPGTNVPQPHPPWACEMGPPGWEEDLEIREHFERVMADEDEASRLADEDEVRREKLQDEMDMTGYDPMGLDGGDQ